MTDIEDPGTGLVLVGLESSRSGRAALDWAAAYARSSDLPLLATHVLSPPGGGPMAWSSGFGGIAYDVVQDAEESTKREMEAIFAEVGPEPGWRLEFVVGAAGRILVEESSQASLLVLGTRDHVGIDRFLVGSVSHYCLSHATCPVLAVPAAVVLAGI